MVNEASRGDGAWVPKPRQPEEAPISHADKTPGNVAKEVLEARKAAQADEDRGDPLKPSRPRKRGLRRRRSVALNKIARSIAWGGLGTEFYPVGRRYDETIRNVAGYNADGRSIQRR